MTQPVRILHVDDNPEFTALTAEFLERENEDFEVVTETSATDALDRLDDERVDCIVSDYRMPGMDGLAFLDAVRDADSDLPFILFTNQGSEEVAAEAIERGVTSYLRKEHTGTVQYTRLANRIRTHVEKHQAEHRARRLEREYELAARTATDVFWTLDRPAETMSFSDDLEHFGYDPAETNPGVDLEWFFDRIHSDDRERIRRHYEALLARQESAFDEIADDRGEFSDEFRFRRADGTYADCHGRGIVLFDGDEAKEVVGTMTDVTDHKRRERQLEETSRQLEAIIEAAPDAIVMLDEDGTIERWNPAAERLFGWEKAEVLGDVPPVVPDDRRETFAGMRDRLLDGTGDQEPIVGYETKREHKDGTLVDVSLSLAPVRDGDGDITGVMAILKDISDRKARERELERERDRRAALFENTPDPIMEVDFEDGTPLIDGVNAAFEDVFGIDAEAATGRAVADTVVPDSERVEHDRLGDRVFRGEAVEAEVQRETSDGVREFLLRIIPFDVDDVSGGAYAWYTDITERKERERELKRYERIVREMNDGVVVVQDGEITDTNPEVSGITGYSQERIEGTPMDEFIAPGDRETVRQRYRQRIAGEDSPTAYEIDVLSKDGGTVPVEITVASVEYDDEPATVSIVRDVSERKEHQRELEAAKRRFDAVFNNPIAFMALCDPDGTVTGVNDTALEFADEPREAVLGEPFPETPWWSHSDALQDDLRSWMERASDGEVVRFEADHYAPDGEKVTIDGVLHPIRNDEGVVTSVLAAGRDISGRKQREQELERQNERLEEFVSIVSHDLRNPLSVAVGRLELVAEECDSEHIDVIERAHDRIETMIDDLLTLARQGETPTEVTAIGLAGCARASWGNVQTGEAMLVTDTEWTVRADRGRLKQLFENLIRNAVEHGGDGVTVTVGDLPGGFYVEDDGPGIPEDDRDQVFESGFSTSEDGTGFGLSIVREIADAHDWEIGVTDGEAGGARFEITGVELVE